MGAQNKTSKYLMYSSGLRPTFEEYIQREVPQCGAPRDRRTLGQNLFSEIASRRGGAYQCVLLIYLRRYWNVLNIHLYFSGAIGLMLKKPAW